MIGKKKGATTWWDKAGTTAQGTKHIKNIFDSTVFDFAKPIGLIKNLLQFIDYKDNDLILDFFSGSGTTAHAVMELNAEDGGNRKYIMVQLPEVCGEKTEAFKAGYKNICEIGKERIRRAGKLINNTQSIVHNENNPKQTTLDNNNNNNNCELDKNYELDKGFKVFKLDTSNNREWDFTYRIKDFNEDLFAKRLNNMIKRVKPGRTDLDMVYEVMLKLGLELTEKVTKLEFDGKVAYSVREDCLILICLDKSLQTETIKKMADLAPAYMIFGQESFDDLSDISNAKFVLKDLKIDMKFV
eukprot:TRINITY_DN2185_c0_g1_i3.p1 TRINITY_DN2185_c0_g1~~TRINITY_DN2185_c0_g1_i3.p1  ORF type:complete len:332 (+),score=-2.92 TRINITY_DN2185_c0_g1_i3:101-997(+)